MPCIVRYEPLERFLLCVDALRIGSLINDYRYRDQLEYYCVIRHLLRILAYARHVWRDP